MMTLGTSLLLVKYPDRMLLRNWFFFCLLFLSSYVDHFIYIIPNEEILLALFLWGLWELWMGDPFRLIFMKLSSAVIFVAGILFVTILLEASKKQRMLGRGDIKLLFVCVLFLGFEKSLYVFALACLCGLLILALRGKQSGYAPIPFGPCIAFSCFLMMIS